MFPGCISPWKRPVPRAGTNSAPTMISTSFGRSIPPRSMASVSSARKPAEALHHEHAVGREVAVDIRDSDAQSREGGAHLVGVVGFTPERQLLGEAFCEVLDQSLGIGGRA